MFRPLGEKEENALWESTPKHSVGLSELAASTKKKQGEFTNIQASIEVDKVNIIHSLVREDLEDSAAGVPYEVHQRGL